MASNTNSYFSVSFKNSKPTFAKGQARISTSLHSRAVTATSPLGSTYVDSSSIFAAVSYRQQRPLVQIGPYAHAAAPRSLRQSFPHQLAPDHLN